MENLIEMLKHRCQENPNKTAFLTKQESKWNPTTWAEVNQETEEIAAGLIALGLKPGDTICILGNTRLEWTLCDLGAVCAGVVSVGIYHTLSGDQSAYIIKDSGAKIIVVENEEQFQKMEPHFKDLPSLKWVIIWEEISPKSNCLTLNQLKEKGRDFLKTDPKILQSVSESVKPDDIAILVYTSGTTGPPKGACLTHKNVLAEMNALNVFPKEVIGDRMMFFLTLAHVGERVAGQYMRIHKGITGA